MKSKITILISLALFLLVGSLSLASADLSLISRSPSGNLYYNNTNYTYVSKVYARPVNLLNLSNEYQPYGIVSSLAETDYNLTLSWNNQSVILEFYTRNSSGFKELFSEKTQQELEDINLSTTIMSGEGIYEYEHNMTSNLSLQPNKFGYDIITNNVTCYSEDIYKIVCGAQLLDFSKAVNVQGFTVIVNESYVEFNSSDMSFIDPSIRISVEDSGNTDTVCYDTFEGGEYFWLEDELEQVGTDYAGSTWELCNAWIVFDTDSLEDPQDIVEITQVQFEYSPYFVDDDCGIVDTDFGLIDDPENYDLTPDSQQDMESLFSRLEQMSQSPYNLFSKGFDIDDEDIVFVQDVTTNLIKEEIMENINNPFQGAVVVGMEGDDEIGENDDCKVDFDSLSFGPNPPALIINYKGKDKTAPSTSASAIKAESGESYDFGEEISEENINVTLSCTDTGPSDEVVSGCSVTKYCVDSIGSCAPAITYTGPVMVSLLGESFIRYRSLDNAQNIESVHEREMFIEKDYPINASLSIFGTEVWSEEEYFTTKERTRDFSQNLNNALDSCVADEQGYCNIPLTLNSDNVGKINVSGIDVYYNISDYLWNTSGLPELNTYKVRVSSTDGIFNSSWDESDSDFIIGDVENQPPSISFVSPTPANNSIENGTSIYVNLSTSDSDDHYSFVDFDNDVALWMRMDDVDGSGNPIDDSIYNNTGDNQGANVAQTQDGYFAEGFEFLGDSSSWVNVTDTEELSIQDELTISLWINLNDYSNYGPMLDKGNSYWFGFYQTTGRLRADLYIDSSWDDLRSDAGDALNLSTWYHAVFVYNGTTMSIFRDGEEIKSQTRTGMINDETEGLHIGADPEMFGLNGTIDELLIFNRALSETEIKALYNSSLYQYENNFTNLEPGEHNFIGHAVDSQGARNETDYRTVTISSPLDLPVFDVVYQNILKRIFRFNINNTLDSEISDIAWKLDFGDGNNLTSETNTTLEGGEDLLVYAFYEYTGVGPYTVTAYAENQNYSTQRSIEIVL